MKIKANVPGLSVLFVSVFLTVILFSILIADTQGRSLNDRGDFVWQGFDGNDWEIFLYSKQLVDNVIVRLVTQITDNQYDDLYPQINSKGQIVWQGFDGNDYEIFLYSKGLVTQITDNQYDDLYPQINSKGQIVWQGFDGNDWEIFLYSNGIITQITDNEYDDLINIKH
jgi:hypothetical protein